MSPLPPASPLPELDFAYGAPEQGPWNDPVGEERWQALLCLWLADLQPELPAGLRAPAYSLGLQFCDDASIAELNGSWRQKPEATDVLAFAAQGGEPDQRQPLPPGEPLELGDIVISLETAARQRDPALGLDGELLFLASHGLLHLLGWDHPDDQQLAAMLERQQRLLALSPLNLSPAEIGGNVPIP
ncbi:MAG: rRNA maturation RNase YbeY [Synechococcaceae bacterium WB9_2_170]|nr:rRNA maturation RNase YbeY [Synechococcaceae bacterium WB9_2_170]